ncbi:MAG: 5-bromo-4-chloroindolyl phosphate hydrolysis family protein [Lachnospiraceae bacterium]|nr:5-bromo-4-chloroindolyl phosphate hydrolysis family protein [Lachnospiraceae bacterium]
MRRNRIKRAERYVALCGGKSYIDIEELARQMGKSKKHILKDVKKMIKLGIFPEGHLDAQESCLILDDATFRGYLKLEKERKALEMEEKVARMQEKQKAKGAYVMQEKQIGDEQPLIKEGNDCIRKLRKLNEDIEGEVISAKLSSLENLLQEIFDRVKEHPEQMPQMQKFMNYYLPTTLKLVEAYREFDDVSVPGADIASAKIEIEQTLDTINQAFAELLNKLFRSTVYDVTTDAQVLQTMLAKEGLTGNKDFK